MLNLNLMTVFTIVLCVIIYGYFKHTYNYWNRKNVPNIPGNIPFGNLTSVILRKQSFTEKINEIYREMKSAGCKYVGLYFFTRKPLLVIDPELVKRILCSDFQYFPDRGIYYDETNDPLSAHLVAISGDRWKELRQKLSPTFSSGKLKGMFGTVLECARHLTEVLKQSTGRTVEIKDLAARYTTDVIGSCAFGIECNSLVNPDAEFRKIGKKVLQSNFLDGIKRLVIRNAPWLARKLKFKVISQEVSKFFIDVVKETIEHRQNAKISRKDFLQLLMELMDKDVVNNETAKEEARFHSPLTLTQATAHVFVFFLAGFETSASTITFSLYELSRNVDVQDQMRKEIFHVMRNYGDCITYEAIMQMDFMEQVLLETMRKYPTFVMLMRKCTRDYNLPDCNIILHKGTTVIIPVYALHHDPEFFPNPEQFQPERFANELNKSKMDYVYLPFGRGPRICIGLRFAMIQMKIALAVLLSNFKFTLNTKTDVPLKMNPNNLILSPLGGTWLNVSPLTNEDKQI